MKTSLNKHKRSAAGLLIAVAAFAAALTGCQKDFEMDLPLAVAARELSLSKEAGSTHVLVYSNGEWTARFTRNVKWASLNKLEGYGNHEIVFTYAANYGISRKVGVVFQKGELADTVMFTQAGTVARVRQTRRSAIEGAIANLRTHRHQPAVLHRRRGGFRHLLRCGRSAR